MMLNDDGDVSVHIYFILNFIYSVYTEAHCYLVTLSEYVG